MSAEEKTFTIRLTVPRKSPNGLYKSETEEHFGTLWNVDLFLEDCTSFICLCSEEDVNCRRADDWRICAEIKASVVLGMDESVDVGKEKKFEYGSQMGDETFYLPHRVETRLRDHLMFEEVVVEMQVKITSMFGVTSQSLEDFSKKELGWSDVVLKVGARKFHVNKATLARISPVFQVMFFGQFKEATAEEISIEAADPDVFEAFLQLCHSKSPRIKVTDVPDILELSDRYDVPSIKTGCEKHLLVSDDVDRAVRFKLAEQYNFEHLMMKLLRDIKEVGHLKELKKDLESFGPKVRAALFRKILALDRQRARSKITVEGIHGEQYNLKIDPSETVASIVRKVAKIEGNPMERQRLKFDGQVLEKRKRLFELDLSKPGEPIHSELSR